MKLEDTVALMLSKDYKERFLAEYYQLEIRINRLKDKLNDPDFMPKCPRDLLRHQLKAMEDYKDNLIVRADIFEDIQRESPDVSKEG